MNNLADTWLGTPLNMAPEILEEKRYGIEADLYSLGVSLFQMLTGRYPFTGNSE